MSFFGISYLKHTKKNANKKFNRLVHGLMFESGLGGRPEGVSSFIGIGLASKLF